VILSARPTDWGAYLASGPIASQEFMEGLEDLADSGAGALMAEVQCSTRTPSSYIMKRSHDAVLKRLTRGSNRSCLHISVSQVGAPVSALKCRPAAEGSFPPSRNI